MQEGVSTDEADRKAATEIREKEAVAFSAEEKDLVEAIDTLERTIGIQMGILDGWQAYYFDSQDWEFLELGRIWQELLLAGFGLWVLVLFRGV